MFHSILAAACTCGVHVTLCTQLCASFWCSENQRIVSELYCHQQSLRTVNSEELEAVADEMRGKEDT